MAAPIRREISGPQDRFEQRSGATYRDVRPTVTKALDELKSQTSALLLAGLAAATAWQPGLVDLTLPLSLLYAGWVLTRRVRLPLHLPLSAKRPDYNNVDPKDRRPRRAAGAIFIGVDAVTGQELWLSAEAGRQHGTIPGTTGAGKTAAILAMLTSALAQGSGFVLVDGKAVNTLYGEVLALARRFGREDDVLALNFLTASGAKDSNTFNPFAVGNADAIRELLVSQLGETQPNDANGVFRARATALVGTIAPVLTWMRDTHGVPISIDTIRFSMELRWIGILAKHRVFLVRNKDGGNPHEYKVPEIPDDIIYPLQAYLGEIPGYDTTVDWNQQRDSRPSEQHGFALMYFTSTFTQLSVSLGHIFRVENGDIDMRDIVLNRRILVVNLPALENSDDTLAALGKIVVAAVRGMLAQLLGARLDGDASEIFNLKPGVGEGPFQIVFDELAYYVTSGMDRMLAMGRGLNVMFWLAFQEISGMWARIGEKTNSLLGNANLTIAMRQQDVSRTREWLEKTAGQSNVTQATSFEGGSTGNYREGRHAEIRQVNRVDWLELQRLIEGEAIVMYGGRRIYAKLFHAQVEYEGRPIRRAQPLMLPAPAPDAPRDPGALARNLAEAITSGRIGVREADPEVDPVIAHMVSTYGASLRAGLGIEAAARSAFANLRQVAPLRPTEAPFRTPDPTETVPETDLSHDLREGAERPRRPRQTETTPDDPVNGALVRSLMAIEEQAGASPEKARRIAYAIIGERDLAVRQADAFRVPRAEVQDILADVATLRLQLAEALDERTDTHHAA